MTDTATADDPAFSNAQTTDPALRRRILVCVIPALIVPFIGALLYYYVFFEQPLGKACFLGTKVFTLVWPLIAVLLIERHRLHPSHWLDRVHLRAIPMGLLTGGAIFGATLLLFYFTPLGDYVRAASAKIAARTEGLGIMAYYIPFAIFLSLIHSLLEEYYWRWYVYGRLARVTRPVWAHSLTAVGFTLHHFVVLSGYFSLGGTLFFGFAVGVGSLIWSWQLERSGSLMGAWVSHMLVDAVLMYLGYILIFPA